MANIQNFVRVSQEHRHVVVKGADVNKVNVSQVENTINVKGAGGLRGLTGPEGPQGVPGQDGADGNGITSTVLNPDYTLTITFSDGTTYTTPSIRGAQGEQGVQGIPGEPGATGNGIASTVLNADYTLTITFTNGQTYTTPSIRGEQGATGQTGETGAAATIAVGTTTTLNPGSSATVENVGTTGAAVFNFGIPKGEKGDKGDAGAGLVITGSVNTYADLPTNLGPSDAGKAYFVQADGKLYVWSGTQFPADGEGSQFEGPQGPQGEPGQDAPLPEPIKTASGSTIALTDAGPGLYTAQFNGDTTQQTYTGKNKLNVSDSYTVSSSDIFKEVAISATSGVSYRVSCTNITTNGTGTCRIGFNDGGGNNVGTVWLSNTNKSANITLTGDAVSVYIYSDTNYSASQSATTTYTDLMVAEASTSTDYEPYTGGIASPNPDYPQNINVVTGTQTITISDGGGQSRSLTVNLGSIELCKIGTYQDYIYKSGDDWYVHKAVAKIASYNGETVSTDYISTTGQLTTGATVYYALATATDTKITDSTLVGQLEAVLNASLYEGDCSIEITATSPNLPAILSTQYFTWYKGQKGDGATGGGAWGTITGNIQIQTDLQNEFATKVDKETGKGLSSNDFTTAEKNKLSGIAAGAEVNVQANWTEADNTKDDYIKNKPTLATVATSGSYNDLSNKPSLANVATSGDYDDLTDCYFTDKTLQATWDSGNSYYVITTTSPVRTTAPAVGDKIRIQFATAHTGSAIQIKVNSDSALGCVMNTVVSTNIDTPTVMTECSINRVYEFVKTQETGQSAVWSCLNAYDKITSSQIADNAITGTYNVGFGGNIALDSIGTANLANNTVTVSKMEDTGWLDCPYESGYKASTNTNWSKLQARVVASVLYLRGGVSKTSGSFADKQEVQVASLPSTITNMLTNDSNANAIGRAQNFTLSAWTITGTNDTKGRIMMYPIGASVGWCSAPPCFGLIDQSNSRSLPEERNPETPADENQR